MQKSSRPRNGSSVEMLRVLSHESIIITIMDISVNAVEMLMVGSWKQTFIIPRRLHVDFKVFNMVISSFYNYHWLRRYNRQYGTVTVTCYFPLVFIFIQRFTKFCSYWLQWFISCFCVLFVGQRSCILVCVLWRYTVANINPLKTKRRPLYLNTQSVPRCKHFSSRL
jgi:hypothetical protein